MQTGEHAIKLHLAPCPGCRPAEYCGGGSLYDCLSAAREQPAAAAQLTWHRRLAMAIDAATGLLYLHHRGIIHRDGALLCCLEAYSLRLLPSG